MTAVLIGAIVVLVGVVFGALQGRRNRQEPALLRLQVWQVLLGLALLVVLAAHTRLGLTLPNLKVHHTAWPHVHLSHLKPAHLKLSGMIAKAGLGALALLLFVVFVLRRRRAAAA